MGMKELGARLRDVRDLRGLSLKAVADPADISSAYLQKLERGEVQSPSPHILYRLADVLNVPYLELMRLAGYLRPTDTSPSESHPGRNILWHALNSEDLTDDEVGQIAEYLAWMRSRKEVRKG